MDLFLWVLEAGGVSIALIGWQRERWLQSVDQVACQQHRRPVGDQFQATDQIADHQNPDCASPDCAAAVENVHP